MSEHATLNDCAKYFAKVEGYEIGDRVIAVTHAIVGNELRRSAGKVSGFFTGAVMVQQDDGGLYGYNPKDVLHA